MTTNIERATEVIAVSVNVAIPVDVFTGLDLHRPITITQEES